MIPNAQIGQDRHRDLPCPASGGVMGGADIRGKKAGISGNFDRSDKPSVYIVFIHASGSGFPVYIPMFAGREEDGVSYGTHMFRREVKTILE